MSGFLFHKRWTPNAFGSPDNGLVIRNERRRLARHGHFMRSAARLAIPTRQTCPDGPDDRPGPEGNRGRLHRGRARQGVARPTAGAPARTAGAPGAVRNDRGGDRRRPRHVPPGQSGSRSIARWPGSAPWCWTNRSHSQRASPGASEAIRVPPSRGSRPARPPGSLLPRGRDPGPGGQLDGRPPVSGYVEFREIRAR